MPKAFFVYGTLKVGGFYANNFDRLRKSSVKAKIKGTMFNVHNHYPAVVPSEVDEVQGELHYYDSEDEVTQAMDRIEGYSKGHGSKNLYVRKRVDVELEDGSTIQASTYFFNRDTEKLTKVADGVWNV